MREPGVTMRRPAVHGAVLAALIAGSAWTLGRHGELAGITSDEGMGGCWAQQIQQGNREAGFNPDHPHYFKFLGRSLPLAAAYYRGPWEYYTAVPFVWAFDRVDALRRHVLFWAVLGVCSTYWLAYLLTQSLLLSALCATALATFQPYAHLVKMGVVIGGAPQVALCTAALGLLVCAARGSRRAWPLSCLLAGLAAGFGPQGAAFTIAWCVCVAWSRGELRAPGKRRALSALFLLPIGVLPLLIVNALEIRDGTSRLLERAAVTPLGIRNAAYGANLSARLEQLLWLLGSRDTQEHLNYFGDRFWPALIGACVAAGAASWAWRARRGLPVEKPSSYVLITMTAVLLLSPFTLFSSSTRHLLIILPLGLIAAAAAPRLFPDRSAARARAAVAALMACGIGVNAVQLSQYWSDCEKHGVRGMASVDTLTLGGWLAGQDAKHIYVFSWETQGALCHLTYGRAKVFNYETRRPVTLNPTYTLAVFLKQAVRTGGYFVLEPADPARTGTLALIAALARENGRKVAHVRDFHRPEGAVVFEVYRLL